jgi:PAS domain S-box-containing protein
MRIMPYRTTDDRIDGVVLTFVDITSRVNAEQAVRAGEQRMRLLIERAEEYAIFTMTSDGTIDSWNVGAERMFGYRPAEAIGQHGRILFTPEDRAAGAAESELRTAATEGRSTDERFHLRKDGSRFFCSGVTMRLGESASLGFAKIARDLTEQRKANDALRDAHAGLEANVQARTRELHAQMEAHAAAEGRAMALLRRLVTAQEEERARISRDLHDQLGQQMTALRLSLDRQRERCPAELRGELDRAIGMAAAMDREVDFLAWELRPAALDDLGLGAALERFLRDWSAHYGIAAQFHGAAQLPEALPAAVQTTFYRIAQEALNNVVKHAHASRVEVLLERRDGEAVMVVEDDGVGFDPNEGATERGIGLIGMRERAALVGGTVQIESRPGHGASVFVRCPVKPPAALSAS